MEETSSSAADVIVGYSGAQLGIAGLTNLFYQLFDSIEGCARVCDDVTYPRYNTEYHPFYKVEIDDIREYCKD